MSSMVRLRGRGAGRSVNCPSEENKTVIERYIFDFGIDKLHNGRGSRREGKCSWKEEKDKSESRRDKLTKFKMRFYISFDLY